MAVIKCKMCGGDLVLVEGQSVAECEYCGSRQTVPAADSEKKLQQFERADWLRRNCEFDKAAAVYETILSEFRQESEAYWGLVLCKYGIEYVDDPGTGKKIPTCHRSSFDSVLDDPNLEQALDYADSVARKVYREEAKQLEKLREGILEVSASEESYDIFICYKETDENGERTLDSVIAHDLYTALTDKGYRVFFSRITLQGKLGQAYEPYIFAALNSAKAMLAVGTDPEYYNAVWVKNEWSRYIKLCASDKSRHLIPCYKGLDAYDMPREFRSLQGVDLGKMGAVQDILFNMEKYIPLKKTPVAMQEQMPVGGVGANKIAALLDRGNMALEDGEWAKADAFFEEALNIDSKNAAAYLGKALVQEKCCSLDAFVQQRLDLPREVQTQLLEIQPDNDHIGVMMEKYCIPGFLEQQQISAIYDFPETYPSNVVSLKRIALQENEYWENNKLIARAEKFADGPLAKRLANAKHTLLAELIMRVRKAEEAEAAEKQALQERYDVHLRQSDEETEWLYNDGYARRERHYQRLLKKMDKQDDSQSILKLAEAFSALKDYRDSQKLASYYKKCAEDALKKEKQKMERREKRIENIGNIIGIVFGGIMIMAFLVNMLVKPAFYYLKAERLLEEGHAAEAACYYLRADTFSNSESRYKKIIRNGKKDENLYATNKHIVELTIDGTVEIYHIWDTNCDCGRERINNVKYIKYDEDFAYIYVVRSSGKIVTID